MARNHVKFRLIRSRESRCDTCPARPHAPLSLSPRGDAVVEERARAATVSGKGKSECAVMKMKMRLLRRSLFFLAANSEEKEICRGGGGGAPSKAKGRKERSKGGKKKVEGRRIADRWTWTGSARRGGTAKYKREMEIGAARAAPTLNSLPICVGRIGINERVPFSLPVGRGWDARSINGLTKDSFTAAAPHCTALQSNLGNPLLPRGRNGPRLHLSA